MRKPESIPQVTNPYNKKSQKKYRNKMKEPKSMNPKPEKPKGG